MQRRDEVTIENLDVDLIVQILDDCPVTLAVLFGSYARGEATQLSDIDIAVEFDDSLASHERTQNRLALIEQLSTTLETDKIDVIPLSSAPSALVNEILFDGVLIYGSMGSLKSYQRRPQKQMTHTE
jgi:predicted nucleotidyltransferase